jgi:hypothetical protein
VAHNLQPGDCCQSGLSLDSSAHQLAGLESQGELP